jgi:hypothetical protein
MTKILKTVANLIIFFILAIVFYGAWSRWDVGNLKTFCSEIKPGDPLSGLPELAKSYHLNSRWITKGGVFNKSSNTWINYLPAESTMGEIACAIEHDNVVVISSKYN